MYQYSYNALSRLNTGSQFLNQQVNLKQTKPTESSVPFSVTMSPIQKQRQSYQPIIENYFKLDIEYDEDKICMQCLNNFILTMSEGAQPSKQFVIEYLTGLRNLIDFILNSQQEQSVPQTNQSSRIQIPEIVLLEQKRFPGGINRLAEQGEKSLVSQFIVHQSQKSNDIGEQKQGEMSQVLNQSDSKYGNRNQMQQSQSSFYSEYEKQAQNLEIDLQEMLKQK